MPEKKQYFFIYICMKTLIINIAIQEYANVLEGNKVAGSLGALY